jgi:hypothetical protein
MLGLNNLKQQVEDLDKFHQIEVLKILNSDETCTLNENNNGIFINLTNLNDITINKIKKYLEYVKTQETQLTEIETKKELLTNRFFKDNKDKTSSIDNAEQ